MTDINCGLGADINSFCKVHLNKCLQLLCRSVIGIKATEELKQYIPLWDIALKSTGLWVRNLESSQTLVTQTLYLQYTINTMEQKYFISLKHFLSSVDVRKQLQPVHSDVRWNLDVKEPIKKPSTIYWYAFCRAKLPFNIQTTSLSTSLICCDRSRESK